MKRSLVLSISLISLLSSPAYAADLDPQKGEDLKTFLTSYIDNMTSLAGAPTPTMPNGAMSAEGDVTVEPADKYFKATLPSIKYYGAQGGHLEVGKISINAIPTAKDGVWKMAISMPSKMIGYNAQKIPTTTIEVGKQKLGGIFHEDIQNFSKMKGEYNDISIFSPVEGLTTKIPNITLVHDFAETEDGLFSGPYTYKISGLEFKKGPNLLFGAETIVADGSMNNFDLSVNKKMQEELQDLTKDVQNTKRDINTDGIFNILSDAYFTPNSDVSVNVKLSKVGINKPQGSFVNPEKLVNINDLEFGFGINNHADNKSDLSLSFGYNFPKEQIPQKGGLEIVAPYKTNLALSVEKIPTSELLKLGKASMDNPQAGKQQALVSLPQILTQSGSEIKITDLSIQGAEYSGLLKGSATANAQAAMKATGEMNVKLTGLGALIQKLGQVSAMSPTAGGAQNLIQPLSMLQMFGQQTGEGDTRTYDLKLTEAGQVTLNGSDLSSMFGGGMRSMPAQ